MENENLTQQSPKVQANKDNNALNFAANKGLILGLAMGVIYLLEAFFPQAKLVRTICSLAEIGLLFLVYHFVRTFRQEQMGGYIRFGKAWTLSFWIYAFAALIAAVFQFVHMQFLQPNYLSDLFNQLMLSFEQAGLTSEQMDMFLDMGTPTAIQVTFTYIFVYIMGGAFLSLIMAAICRKEDYLANNQ